MKKSNYINLTFTGSYSLELSVDVAAISAFVEGLRNVNGGKKRFLDLAFPMEGSWKAIAVRIEQIEGVLRAYLLSNPAGANINDIKLQLERILFLNVDGNAFEKMMAHDHVLNQLWQNQPGLRPVLFPSPYEAAARAIIGHQLPVKYAASISNSIAEQYGVAVDFGDRVLYAFPAPAQLADLGEVKGLAARKIEQLRTLGVVANESIWLQSHQLIAKPIDQALLTLQKLPGIGPFSAELVLLRGAGHTDVFPKNELRLQRAMAVSYELGIEPGFEKLERIAEKWRPFRSWAGLLLRNSIPR